MMPDAPDIADLLRQAVPMAHRVLEDTELVVVVPSAAVLARAVLALVEQSSPLDFCTELAALRAQLDGAVRLPFDARDQIERVLRVHAGKPAEGNAPRRE
jgi:hypothetical protein